MDEVRLLMELLSIQAGSGQESSVVSYIKETLLSAGVPDKQISQDRAHLKAQSGATGNLIVKIPGNRSAPRRLLMAHMDTVPLCLGAEPIVRKPWISSKSSQTALGGDDRAGCAVILSTLLKILNQDEPHPPLTFLWTVQEEVGLIGARYVTASKLGKPKLCFNFDGNAPNVAVIGATGDVAMSITISGKASHAGVHPELGISAISIAGLAIADLQRRGWLGLIRKKDGQGTSNIGSIQGGAATNVVTDQLTITAEARSHDPEFRNQIVNQFQDAFEKAVPRVRSADGDIGAIRFEHHLKYESFCLDESEPCVQEMVRAMKSVGLEPELKIGNGGLDANWMTSHGFPTVSVGCGQQNIHTVEERLHIPRYQHACRLAYELASSS